MVARAKRRCGRKLNVSVLQPLLAIRCKALFLKNILFLETIAKQGLCRVVEKNKILFKGFTLAEVLIVLGIIGLIADMTIPTLVQGFNEKASVSRLTQSYSILSQAYKLAILNNGTPENWGVGDMYDENSHKILAKNLSPHLKRIKDCTEISSNTPCSSQTLGKAAYNTFVLANGSLVIMRSWGTNKVTFGNSPSLKGIYGTLAIDINGDKKPNKKGEDTFDFYFSDNGILPVGTEGDRNSFEKNCLKTETPNPNFTALTSCAAWVIYNQN